MKKLIVYNPKKVYLKKLSEKNRFNIYLQSLSKDWFKRLIKGKLYFNFRNIIRVRQEPLPFYDYMALKKCLDKRERKNKKQKKSKYFRVRMDFDRVYFINKKKSLNNLYFGLNSYLKDYISVNINKFFDFKPLKFFQYNKFKLSLQSNLIEYNNNVNFLFDNSFHFLKNENKCQRFRYTNLKLDLSLFFSYVRKNINYLIKKFKKYTKLSYKIKQASVGYSREKKFFFRKLFFDIRDRIEIIKTIWFRKFKYLERMFYNFKTLQKQENNSLYKEKKELLTISSWPLLLENAINLRKTKIKIFKSRLFTRKGLFILSTNLLKNIVSNNNNSNSLKSNYHLDMITSMIDPQFMHMLKTTKAKLNFINKYNPKYNPKFNPKFNPTYNPKFNPKYNPKFNPKFNSKYNFINKFNPKYNSKFNPKFNSKYNPKYNSKFNPKFNSKFNPKYNSKFNPKFNSKFNPKYNSKFNPKFNSKFNPKYIQKLKKEESNLIKKRINLFFNSKKKINNPKIEKKNKLKKKKLKLKKFILKLKTRLKIRLKTESKNKIKIKTKSKNKIKIKTKSKNKIKIKTKSKNKIKIKTKSKNKIKIKTKSKNKIIKKIRTKLIKKLKTELIKKLKIKPKSIINKVIYWSKSKLKYRLICWFKPKLKSKIKTELKLKLKSKIKTEPESKNKIKIELESKIKTEPESNKKVIKLNYFNNLKLNYFKNDDQFRLKNRKKLKKDMCLKLNNICVFNTIGWGKKAKFPTICTSIKRISRWGNPYTKRFPPTWKIWLQLYYSHNRFNVSKLYKDYFSVVKGLKPKAKFRLNNSTDSTVSLYNNKSLNAYSFKNKFFSVLSSKLKFKKIPNFSSICSEFTYLNLYKFKFKFFLNFVTTFLFYYKQKRNISFRIRLPISVNIPHKKQNKVLIFFNLISITNTNKQKFYDDYNVINNHLLYCSNHLFIMRIKCKRENLKLKKKRISFLHMYYDCLVYIFSFIDLLYKKKANVKRTLIYINFYKNLYKLKNKTGNLFFKRTLDCINALIYTKYSGILNKRLNKYIKKLIQIHEYSFDDFFLRRLRLKKSKITTLLDLVNTFKNQKK